MRARFSWFAISLFAPRLAVELCIQNCAGWSSSGGPWIDRAHAMQVIAWSSSTVKGPVRLEKQLPQGTPPLVVGAIPYYRDIAVIAFRTPEAGDVEAPT